MPAARPARDSGRSAANPTLYGPQTPSLAPLPAGWHFVPLGAQLVHGALGEEQTAVSQNPAQVPVVEPWGT